MLLVSFVLVWFRFLMLVADLVFDLAFAAMVCFLVLGLVLIWLMLCDFGDMIVCIGRFALLFVC